jgi:YVTN family beta-propeller protein
MAVAVLATAFGLVPAAAASADAWNSNISTGPAYQVAFTPDGTKAYVTDSADGTVHVIDATAQTFSDITLPDSNADPYSLAVSPDGTKVYVTDTQISAVWVIDVANDTLESNSISVGQSPQGVAFSPDGSKAYVSNEADGTVSVIDVATASVTSTISLPQVNHISAFPSAVSFAPDGTKAYVTDFPGDKLWVIDSSTNSVDSTTPYIDLGSGSGPNSVAFSPDGTIAYVADKGSGAPFDTVSVIDTATNSLDATTPTITVGQSPTGVAFSPGGTKAYVSIQGGAGNTIDEIDVATHTVTSSVTLQGAGGPNGLAFRPQGSTQVYTANQSGNVSVIDVDLPPTHSAGTPPASRTNVSFSFTIPETGSPSITFGLASGSLPPGLTLNSSTGVISGTPTTTGSYTYTITATNGNGTDQITYTQVISDVPGAPTSPAAVAGTSSATVSWAAPSPSTGVTGYTVYAHPGSATCSTSSVSDTSCVIGGTAGTSYTYTVVAHSAGGDSVASVASSPVTPTSPGVPSSAPTSAPTTLTTAQGAITSVTAGEDVTVVGTGFLAYSTATIVAYSSPVVLGTVVTDANGDFSKPVTIPANLEVGSHNLVAFGVDPAGATHVLRLPFAITASPATPTPTTIKALPSTGFDAAPVLWLALLLLMAGGAAVLFTSRLRRHRKNV